MAGYWPRFFCMSTVSVHEHAKKKLDQYQAILTASGNSRPHSDVRAYWHGLQVHSGVQVETRELGFCTLC